MKRFAIVASLLTLAVVSLQFISVEPISNWNGDTPLSEVMSTLGEPAPNHKQASYTPEMVEKGRQLVFDGKADGGTFISKYYLCTNCHNMAIEDPSLNVMNPETRLDYVKQTGQTFKQATTFYGMVNRESWYNDDYIIKYGDAVKPANKNLRNAIQLCATGCSQGRLLDDDELEALLAYCWSLEFKMDDLKLTIQEWDQLKLDAKDSKRHEALRTMLKGKYALKSAATFSEPPADKKAGYPGLTGNAERGELIYELSCMDCHKDQGVSRLILDKSSLTLSMLKRNLMKDSRFSVYEIARHGTHPEKGHKAYMPHFTIERMSHQQVEDLRAYIEQGS